ncbi:MAG: hypothetical protein J6Q54_03640, partial [Oscillospiraceae bacterium]|nr:hypothetical protein [Oscillospiraceae bacterium]
MDRTWKRLLSFVVALVMVFGLIPVTQIEVKAETTDDTYTKDLEFRAEDGKAYCPHCKDWKEWTPIDAAFKGDTSSSARKSGDY